MAVITCILPPRLCAQQANDVTFYFEKDTIEVKAGQTFSNKLIVKNHRSSAIALMPQANNTQVLKGLIKLPDTLFLKANESRSFPLKYMADRQIIHKSMQAFTIGLKSNDKVISMHEPKSFYTKIEQEQGLLLSTEQTEFYLDQNSQQVQFIIRATNSGLVPLTFRLNLSEVPKGLNFVGENMFITVQAGGQMAFPFTAQNQMRNTPLDFNVTIQAIDENGETLNSHRIRIMSIGSVKRFGDNNSHNQDIYNNSFALRYLSMNQYNSIYQLQGNGELALSQEKNLNYRFNFDYFQNQEYMNAYDSYVEYQSKKWGLKVGNVYENLDHNLNGRGLKATYKLEENKAVNLYALENNFLLFGQMNPYFDNGKIIAADYRFQNKYSKPGYVSYVHNNNDFRAVTSDQFNGKTHIHLGDNQQLEVEGGYSLEKIHDGDLKHAISGGFNYTYKHESYQFSSNNYYSSPYYSGLRRGFTQSENHLSKTFQNNQRLLARISFMNNNPKYQAGEKGFRFRNRNQIQIYEIGYHRMIGNLNFNFKPYLLIQNFNAENFIFQQNINTKWKSKAARAALDLSFYSQSHRFSINSDYGYTYKNTSQTPLAPFHSLRVNGSYSNPYVGFNTFIQLNPYYVNDLYTVSNEGSHHVYSFGPTTQFSIFKKQLNIQLAANYNYYGLSQTKNLSANGRINWHLRNNWQLTADVYYTKMQLISMEGFQQTNYINAFNSRQIRIGVVKKFAALKPVIGYKLELTYFEDHNNNGIKDKNEPTVEGILVKINKEATISDPKGKVTFQNLLAGPYTLSIENNKGWVSAVSNELIISKNKSLNIPLVKTKIVRGKIQVINQKYQEASPTIAGIRVNASDDRGNTYRTLTDEQGNYTLYLASGDYNVYIETEGMPFSIENNTNRIQLTEKLKIIQLDFQYKDERRKVGIKRF